MEKNTLFDDKYLILLMKIWTDGFAPFKKTKDANTSFVYLFLLQEIKL